MAFNLGVTSLLVNDKDCFVLDINIKPEIFCCREAELIAKQEIANVFKTISTATSSYIPYQNYPNKN